MDEDGSEVGRGRGLNRPVLDWICGGRLDLSMEQPCVPKDGTAGRDGKDALPLLKAHRIWFAGVEPELWCVHFDPRVVLAVRLDKVGEELGRVSARRCHKP